MKILLLKNQANPQIQHFLWIIIHKFCYFYGLHKLFYVNLQKKAMIKRLITKQIEEKIFTGKAIIIMGARQVGKSFLLRNYIQNSENTVWLDGEEIENQRFFETINPQKIQLLMGNKKILIIDEAQRILNIGSKLKIIIDHLPDIQLIVTGSSSFDLCNKINEPLTGRKWEYQMFPLSFQEMVNHHGFLNEKKLLTHRMVFGYYPDIVVQHDDKIKLLKSLTESYLYKDILQWENIRKSERLIKLLQAIAFQIGSQVTYNELSRICGLDVKTIEKYIDLLEKSFVIFRLSSFSRNLRSELKFSRKIYFYDNGVRNALISNFNDVEMRNDTGALWENFLISERIKKLNYEQKFANYWFWRTTNQKEIDYIEEYNGELSSFEFKWNPKKQEKPVKEFISNYPDASYKIITPENIEDFIL